MSNSLISLKKDVFSRRNSGGLYKVVFFLGETVMGCIKLFLLGETVLGCKKLCFCSKKQ